MTHDTNTLFRRLRRDERGAVLILVAAGLLGFVGFGALAVDVGYWFYARSVIQASANAAALAGAQSIGKGGTPLVTAAQYGSAASTAYNYVGNLSIAMATGSPSLSCASTWATNSGVACSTNQTPPCTVGNNTGCAGTSGANLITVAQTANVSTFFGRIFGISSIPIAASATASAAGTALGPYNVAVILDTTGSMGSAPSGTAAAACAGYTSSAIACAVHGVQVMLGELWPCAAGLSSCGGQPPVDTAALFVFPPVTNADQAAKDIGVSPYSSCANPQIADSYSGVLDTASAATPTTSSTLSLASMTTATAFNTGTWALVTDIGTPTSQATSSGNTLHFPNGVITASVTVGMAIHDTTKPAAIPAGATVLSKTATNVVMSQNVTAGGVGNGDLITFGTSISAISPGSGGNPWPWWANTGSTTISTVTLPTAAVMSANPTGPGILKGDNIIVAPLFQLTAFSNDYRASNTATSLNSSSNIVKATASGCLKTPGGLGTYYADAITAAQTALVAQQAARIAAGQPGGTNVIILLSDGAAQSTDMGPLKTAESAYQCGAAVLAARKAAMAGTWVYAIYYDDGSPSCSDTQAAPGIGAIGTITSSCTAMKQIANAPGATAGSYVQDSVKFYSIDGASSPCASIHPYSTIAQIFQQVVASLTKARLVPVGTS